MKVLKGKEEIRERMKEAAERLRQLSKKFYEDNEPKHMMVH